MALRVGDDRIGFDPRSRPGGSAKGIGLASLVVAVEPAGGSVDFRDSPGGAAW